MFYTYNQNNSGGDFILDKPRGITHFVIIEADSAVDADQTAEYIGLYFGGCGDCPCCGDRWYPTYQDEGEDVPKIYNQEVGKAKAYIANTLWMEEGHEAVIHYKDGTKVWVPAEKVSWNEMKKRGL